MWYNFDSAYDAHQRWIKYVTSLQISLIRIKFDSTFDVRESNAAFVTCDSNQRRPLTFFDHTFDVAQRRFFVQCFEH